MMPQQVYITPMLNIPWGASIFVSIFLSSIQTQQNWTAIIAISRITSNKEKSRQTTISERYKCASTRIGISSRNVTLNRYSKHKLMFTMWQICLVFKICEQTLQSWMEIIHISFTEIFVELFLNPFLGNILPKDLTRGTVTIHLLTPTDAEIRMTTSLDYWVHTCKRLWSTS